MSCTTNTSTNKNASLKLDSIKIGRETKMSTRIFQGLYYPHYSNFINCADGKRYILKSNNLLDSAYNKILPNAYIDEAVFLEINALPDINDTTTIHFGIGTTFKMEQKNYKNTCIASDYWCTGIEPFWLIQISKEEDLIDFYNPMEQKTVHFVYKKPDVKNGLTVYNSTDGENKISVAIKKEKRNGGIDKQYDFSVQVQLNEKKYNGCAIKYGDN